MTKARKTGADTHRATAVGYAIPEGSVAGQLIEAGGLVPANVPLGSWMEPVDGSSALAGAIDEALDPNPKDVDLTKLQKPALEAMAAERGINVQGLDKADLIAAIKAARADTA